MCVCRVYRCVGHAWEAVPQGGGDTLLDSGAVRRLPSVS